MICPSVAYASEMQKHEHVEWWVEKVKEKSRDAITTILKEEDIEVFYSHYVLSGSLFKQKEIEEVEDVAMREKTKGKFHKKKNVIHVQSLQ